MEFKNSYKFIKFGYLFTAPKIIAWHLKHCPSSRLSARVSALGICGLRERSDESMWMQALANPGAGLKFCKSKAEMRLAALCSFGSALELDWEWESEATTLEYGE